MAIRRRIILLSLVLGNLVEQRTPDVNIEQGTLRGRISSDGKTFEYLGVPYGTANATNRFQAPFPPPTWKGTYDAVDEQHRCPQLLGSLSMGEEDCLKINIYTPIHADDSPPLPVMVFFHGGGFLEGSGSRLLYGPKFFVRHDVVLVTFNYRLGALGFLCLGVEGAPGNAGLKDQLAALHWVKNNIKAFGGDPDNVTVLGESAGAASISHIRMIPQAKDLFKRTIMQSGSSLGVWTISRDPIGAASRFASALGFNTNDPSELLKIFNEATTRQLIATDPAQPKGSVTASRLVFLPCIEKTLPGVEAIITEAPYNRLTSGNYTHFPTISGYNDKEGIFLVGKETDETLKKKNQAPLSEYLPKDLEFENDTIKKNVSQNVRKMYFGDKAISRETKINLAELFSDVFFIMPTIFEARIISQTSKQPQYNYVFKYAGYRNLVKFVCGFANESGASHADELFYMFQTNLLPLYFNRDQIVIDRFTAMWTNFAKYGNPTPTPSALLPAAWTPSGADRLRYLLIDEEISMGDPPNQHRIAFWTETYAKYRRKS